MLFKKAKRAQSTAEYAILIALVIAAVSAMQVLIKGGLQQQIKGGMDEYMTAAGRAVEVDKSYLVSGNTTTNQDIEDNTTFLVDGAVTKTTKSTTPTTYRQDWTVNW